MKNLQKINSLIHFIRGQKVMLDSDLAQLYGLETKQLKRSVRRNHKRFPQDFMFQLTNQEVINLRCQIGTLEVSPGKHTKYLPFVFTEQGIAMLSSILNSEKAIEVNIAIMRAFVQMRQFIKSHKELSSKLEKLVLRQINFFLRTSAECLNYFLFEKIIILSKH